MRAARYAAGKPSDVVITGESVLERRGHAAQARGGAETRERAPFVHARRRQVRRSHPADVANPHERRGVAVIRRVLVRVVEVVRREIQQQGGNADRPFDEVVVVADSAAIGAYDIVKEVPASERRSKLLADDILGQPRQQIVEIARKRVWRSHEHEHRVALLLVLTHHVVVDDGDASIAIVTKPVQILLRASMLREPQEANRPLRGRHAAVGDQPRERLRDFEVEAAAARVVVGARSVVIEVSRQQHFFTGQGRSGDHAGHDLDLSFE